MDENECAYSKDSDEEMENQIAEKAEQVKPSKDPIHSHMRQKQSKVNEGVLEEQKKSDGNNQNQFELP